MTVQHAGLAAGRWNELTLCEQLGNIGSEIGRAISAGKRNNDKRKEDALKRAFELFDLTAADQRWKGSKRREVLRSRELTSDFFYGDNEYNQTAALVENYFMQFAMAARINR